VIYVTLDFWHSVRAASNMLWVLTSLGGFCDVTWHVGLLISYAGYLQYVQGPCNSRWVACVIYVLCSIHPILESTLVETPEKQSFICTHFYRPREYATLTLTLLRVTLDETLEENLFTRWVRDSFRIGWVSTWHPLFLLRVHGSRRDFWAEILQILSSWLLRTGHVSS